FIGDSSRGRFKPATDQFPNLARPPFVITGLGHIWGGSWLPLRVVGYIGRKKVAERRISDDGIPQRLEVAADHDELIADGADMTRLSLRITDQFGNILPFAMQPVFVEIKGPGTIVGDNPHPMPGGRGALLIRAGRTSGQITVNALTERLPVGEVRIRVKKPSVRRQM